MKKLAVMHTGSNNIIAIVETMNPRLAAQQADVDRGLTPRVYQEVPKGRADAEYSVHELDASDIKLLSDRDRYTDIKYTNYVRANCKLLASVAIS